MTHSLKLNRIVPLICVLLLALPHSAEAQPVQGASLARYSIEIEYERGVLSGICIINREAERPALSIINEFGIKAFDALYNAEKERVTLLNVTAPLNRRIIKRALCKAMLALFTDGKIAPNRIEWQKWPGGEIKIRDKRFKINYKLQPISDVTQ